MRRAGPPRIHRQLCARPLTVRVRPEPVAAPLPAVADHVVQPVSVHRKRSHRRGALKTVLLRICRGEPALEGVGHPPPVNLDTLTSPRIALPLEPSPRRKLPLGLGRQTFARPLGVGHAVVPRDLYHGMVGPRADIAARALRMAPTRSRHPAPPQTVIIERHGPRRWREHQSPGHQQALVRCRRAGRQLLLQLFPARLTLRRCKVARGSDETFELDVRHLVRVHPEPLDAHTMGRPLRDVRLLYVRAHLELPARDPAHALGRRRQYRGPAPGNRGTTRQLVDAGRSIRSRALCRRQGQRRNDAQQGQITPLSHGVSPGSADPDEAGAFVCTRYSSVCSASSMSRSRTSPPPWARSRRNSPGRRPYCSAISSMR